LWQRWVKSGSGRSGVQGRTGGTSSSTGGSTAACSSQCFDLGVFKN
jgi:hypothetical protein